MKYCLPLWIYKCIIHLLNRKTKEYKNQMKLNMFTPIINQTLSLANVPHIARNNGSFDYSKEGSGL